MAAPVGFAHRIPATPQQEAFYREAAEAVAAVIERYPDMQVLHVICCLARATGYSIAAAFPNERDLARATAIANMDQAVADVAQCPPAKEVPIV